MRSIQLQETPPDECASYSLTGGHADCSEQSRLHLLNGSICESIASYDVQLLHDLLAQSSSGQVLGNFWPHALQPHTSAPSPTTLLDTPVNDNCSNNSYVNTPYTGSPQPEVRLIGPSSALLTIAQMSTLNTSLPMSLQFSKWHLLYSIADHGADIVSFYKFTKGEAHTVLVVETDKGEVFGGFAAEPWRQSVDYYGSGESFVYRVGSCAAADSVTLSGRDVKSVEVFPWSYENNFFMLSNKEQLAMGGGQDGFAFVLDADFITGSSHCSATFRNPPLATSNSDSFQVVNLEVWGFESSLF